VRLLRPARPRLTLLIAIFFIWLVPAARSQDDAGDVSLGDLARSLRKKPASESVIDNDNLPAVMSDAQSRRASGSSPVLALDPVSARVSSPDVTCSLSFNSKSSPFSDTMLLNDLPGTELAKLDGPAAIEGDSFEVTLHNGTAWELHEVVIGLTIVRNSKSDGTASSYGSARIIPASATASQPVQDSFQKQPDVTVLLRVRGSAAPSATATFRTTLNFELFPDQEWHWAIVKAKGVSPLVPLEELTQSDQTDLKSGGAGAPPNPGAKVEPAGELVTSLPALAPAAGSSSPPIKPSH
jgi:hypothetical protein